jgi:hypothetical protein
MAAPLSTTCTGSTASNGVNVGDYAVDLNNDGLSFAEMEQAQVEKLQALHPAPAGLAGSV